MFLLLCFFDLIVLFFLSRGITGLLSQLVHAATGKLSLTVQVFSFLLFPGTLLHECSHYLTAVITGVKVHNFVMKPVLEGEKHVRLGSVSIQKPDALRKLLIGIAPLVIGLFALFFLLNWIGNSGNFSMLRVILVGFIVFQVSNTMFPSKADLTGTIPMLLLFLLLMFGLLFFVPQSTPFVLAFSDYAGFRVGVGYLSWIIAIDLVVFIVLSFLRRK